MIKTVGTPGKNLLAKLGHCGGRLRARNTKAARQLLAAGLAVVSEVGGEEGRGVKVISLPEADKPLTAKEARELPI